MRGLTNRSDLRRQAANGLLGLYRQKSAGRTSEYCDMARFDASDTLLTPRATCRGRDRKEKPRH
jgi:hypothetical protein